jgi:hypothetical protein
LGVEGEVVAGELGRIHGCRVCKAAASRPPTDRVNSFSISFESRAGHGACRRPGASNPRFDYGSEFPPAPELPRWDNPWSTGSPACARLG